MKSRWSDPEFRSIVDGYVRSGLNRDLATRVYTTRLLGGDPELVLHGGGNTSVKTVAKDADAGEVAVICVKGSGWDMATIEPPGLPAVRLKELAALARFDALSDMEMVRQQRRLLMDPAAPNPSVEAILHALIPARHVDHTHANAIVSITNQPDGEALVRGLSLHGQWTQEFEPWRIREIPKSLAEQHFTPEVSVTLIGNLPIANW